MQAQLSTVEVWGQLEEIACRNLKELGLLSNREYIARLKTEIAEINKQAANRYWINLYNSGRKFDNNKNGLVLPFLLGLTPVDPIKAGIQHVIYQHADFPDIDIDFLPSARDPIKEYARAQYGEEKVCSIGLWQKYKPKLALQDAASALGISRGDVIKVCKDLPKEFDDMSLEEALGEYEQFKQFSEQYPQVVDYAYRMVGKIKAQGRHAGGLIIANVPLREYIPMTLCGQDGEKQWTSEWTEGMAATQLSPFGFIKFDILGLSNLYYIWKCCQLVKQNRGISIDLNDIDPEDDRLGWTVDADGNRTKVTFSDPEAIKEADEVRVDTVFQFDTGLGKSILQKGGATSFMDLVVYSSLARPGPLPMVDVYIKNRDDPSWKETTHPKLIEMLKDTHGVLTFQETLTKFFVEICGFTVPEAIDVLKVVKKKKGDVLNNDILPRMVKGATPVIGEEAALDWRDKIVSFGRYCFNRSHAIAYTIISYQCLWLKRYFPAEWWAAVLSECDRDKRIAFMGVARSEGIKFGTINVNKLSAEFTVLGDEILPGLSSVKGLGGSTAEKVVEASQGKQFTGVDDFIAHCGGNKTALERIIKLGGFSSINPNTKALWMWYQYAYGVDKASKELRLKINHCYAWPADKLIAERRRQTEEFKKLYPKKKQIPKKVLNWVPSTPHRPPAPFNEGIVLTDEQIADAKSIKLEYDDVVALFPKNYSLQQILDFEKEYLGYYWNSPLDVFDRSPNTDIESAKKKEVLECVIDSVETRQGARGNTYIRLTVTDGIRTAKVNVWTNEYEISGPENFQPGVGLRMVVEWSDTYRSFSVKRNKMVMLLTPKLEEEENE
jgi:DNA polymerase III alpha subunit